jgi:hypothetical protein
MRHILLVEQAPASSHADWAASLPSGFTLEICRAPEQLATIIGERPPVLIIVPLSSDTTGADVRLAHRLTEAHPEIPLVAWCAEEAAIGNAVLHAARAGVEHFAFAGVDSLGTVLNRLVPEGTVDVAHVVRAALAALPPLASNLIQAMLSSDRRLTTVADLAAAVGLAERTLLRRCAARSWPSPRTFLRWGGLLRGLLALEVTGDADLAAAAAGCRTPRLFFSRLCATTGTRAHTPVRQVVDVVLAAIAEALQPAAGTATLPTGSARARSASKRIRRDECGEDGAETADGAQLEWPHPSVALREVTKRAG